jgi:hypothetical protein
MYQQYQYYLPLLPLPLALLLITKLWYDSQILTCIGRQIYKNRLMCTLADRKLHAIRLHRVLDWTQSGFFKSRIARDPATQNLGLQANLGILHVKLCSAMLWLANTCIFAHGFANTDTRACLRFENCTWPGCAKFGVAHVYVSIINIISDNTNKYQYYFYHYYLLDCN